MSSFGICAIITARGGSKRLPNKNIKNLCGKPLIAYSIQAALNCGVLEGCYVTTDEINIASVASKFGAEIINRPSKLATDTASSYDVVLHALKEIKSRQGVLPEAFVLLQPTSPLRTAESLKKCIAEWEESGAASAVSIVKMEHHPYKTFLLCNGKLEPMMDFASLNIPNQSLPEAYRTNGAIYIVKTIPFIKERTFFPSPQYFFYMSNSTFAGP